MSKTVCYNCGIEVEKDIFEYPDCHIKYPAINACSFKHVEKTDLGTTINPQRLIICTECGKEISNKAPICPHCGIVRKKMIPNQGSWISVILACIIIEIGVPFIGVFIASIIGVYREEFTDSAIIGITGLFQVLVVTYYSPANKLNTAFTVACIFVGLHVLLTLNAKPIGLMSQTEAMEIAGRKLIGALFGVIVGLIVVHQKLVSQKE